LNSEYDKVVDLPTKTFLVLRDRFFDDAGQPIDFSLRDKKNTQDDPLDEYLHNLLSEELGCNVVKASPLVSPDMVAYTEPFGSANVKDGTCDDVTKILAIEVKKLDRTPSGATARASGIDYNSTPPCGKVRVYAQGNKPLDIRAFYLFVCQENATANRGYKLTSLALCDGNALNSDFSLYLSAIEPREKEIELGTYADGLNRNRPMFVFSNPLGLSELDYHATLIHISSDLDQTYRQLTKVYELPRLAKTEKIVFWCYRCRKDVIERKGIEKLRDFPTPTGRKKETQTRGRLRLPINI
jgi:hypothetical protein